MKIEKIIASLLFLLLAGAMLAACKSSIASNAQQAQNANSLAASDNSATVQTNKIEEEPQPANCPARTEIMTPDKLADGKIDKYVGCALQVAGKLRDVEGSYVTLLDETSKKTIECHGDFYSDTYKQIGEKLSAMKLKGSSNFPNVMFKGKVKQWDNPSNYFGLSNCEMSEYLK